jgi:DNA invertase Pin-like site-specific DNA recombinase
MGDTTGELIGYARVSTREQRDDSQIAELTAAGCSRIFADKGVSGKLASRPELDKALAYLRPGDVLVITRLSRAMRNIRELLNMVHDLEARGIGLKVLKQGIDTTTPTGRLTFHIFAAIDEWQRELIVEGTREGLEAARARGKVGGRRPKLSDEQAARAQELYDGKQLTIDEIAAMLHVGRSTLYRALSTDGKAAAS